MPGVTTLDLTPLWQREISVAGAYAYGTETVDGQRIRTFDLAAELVAAADLGRLVSATYPLDRFGDATRTRRAAGSPRCDQDRPSPPRCRPTTRPHPS